MNTHVVCFQQFTPSVKPPVVVRLLDDNTRATISYKGAKYVVHRGSCSTVPFDPAKIDEYRLDPEVRKKLGQACMVDPIANRVLVKKSYDVDTKWRFKWKKMM